MALFGQQKRRRSVALIDIGSASVGGAFAHIESMSAPTVYFTARLPIEAHQGEQTHDAMLRSLTALTRVLVEHGAPALRRESGSAHIDSVLVSVASPWQDTDVRVETKQDPKAFLFTHALMNEMVEKGAQPVPGRVRTNESVIGTMLNGYEIGNPFNKKVRRADLVVLSSTIEKTVLDSLEQVLRKGFHTHAIETLAFAPVAYDVFRDLYPHEKDYLIFDVTGDATDIVFVKRGVLAAVTSVPQGTNDLKRAAREAGRFVPVPGEGPQASTEVHTDTNFSAKISEVERAWLDGLTKVLKEFASRHALPRTLLLLADLDSREFLHQLLDNPTLRSIWLSDDPLTIIPVSPKHLAEYVRTRGEAEGDVFLAMLALYGSKHLLMAPVTPVIPTKKA